MPFTSLRLSIQEKGVAAFSGEFIIRSAMTIDFDWIANVLKENWGSPRIISRGTCHDAARLPGFMAVFNEQRAGLVTYHIKNNDCELVALISKVKGIGIGSALVEAVQVAALSAGCRRLWLVTTNDNTDALRFYQKRGFVLVAVHRNAVDRSRELLKPEIPLFGAYGIRMRDEIELEISFTSGRAA
jgi:GNAT superfamily N-acetyltransferase